MNREMGAVGSPMSKLGFNSLTGLSGAPISRPARVGPAGLAGGRTFGLEAVSRHKLPWCGRDNPRAVIPSKGSTARGISLFARSTAGATRSELRARAQRGGLWIVGGVR